EYIGFHPAISALILAGWLAFLWTFLRRVARGFWGRPAYVYMWTIGAVLFVYTFTEAHAHLLPFVSSQPVADTQIQWKSCGTLVASFNQMVYGCLLYVGERLSGDRHAAQSRSAFALLGIGVLNSFTNYAHHTYHLPQSHLIKWVAFSVSMLEIIILWSLLRGIVAGIQRGRPLGQNFVATTRLFSLSKGWNAFLLPVALLISVPPLNALIHGTHVVMAHAMGSELAIDSYILLGVFAWLLASLFPKRESIESVINAPLVRRTLFVLNTALILLVACLLVGGLAVGVTRYLGQPRPQWMKAFPVAFALLGGIVGYGLLRIVTAWLPLFRDPLRHKLFRHDPRWDELVEADLPHAPGQGPHSNRAP
ncbi:MAG: cbb3-type cytochrome c oxidase subunit I, partial [bacterium]|nr:cbb3-type cytochrome c oxidase subunit I [bacterium]